MTKLALFVAATAALVVVVSAASDSTDRKEVRQCGGNSKELEWVGGANRTRKKVNR